MDKDWREGLDFDAKVEEDEDDYEEMMEAKERFFMEADGIEITKEQVND